METEKINELEKIINDNYGNTTGIVVLKDGDKVYEKYFNGAVASSKIHVYSVTKSITSILIGIAIDKGYIKSIDQKVLEFFPNYQVKKGEKTIQNITLKQLLTMTAPYKYRFAPYIRYFKSTDWINFSLDLLGGKGQIGQFRYAPLIGPDILSGILIKATGQTVFDFAKENLFEPLEIIVEKNIMFKNAKEQMAFNQATNISGWVVDLARTNAAGWGLTLSAEEMAKIGQLYLDRGIVNGTQIVSSSWIAQSTSEQSIWEKENLSYGYLWWIIDKKDGAFAAMGDGGNIIYVNPTNKMVISIASLFKQNARDRIELIKQYIEPIF